LKAGWGAIAIALCWRDGCAIALTHLASSTYFTC